MTPERGCLVLEQQFHGYKPRPAPQHTSTTWSTFLRSQTEAIIALDFFPTVTLAGAHLYAFTAIEHAILADEGITIVASDTLHEYEHAA